MKSCDYENAIFRCLNVLKLNFRIILFSSIEQFFICIVGSLCFILSVSFKLNFGKLFFCFGSVYNSFHFLSIEVNVIRSNVSSASHALGKSQIGFIFPEKVMSIVLPLVTSLISL